MSTEATAGTTGRPARPRGTRLAWNKIEREAGSDCMAEVHGPSNRAWRYGCRCTMAVAAHDQFLAEQRERRAQVQAASIAAGKCLATRHGSDDAARNGCVCYRRPKKRPSGVVSQSGLAGAYAARYNRFRGPTMKVDRYNLILLLSGIVDQPTRGEMIAAVHILQRRGNRAGTGLFDAHEIASRLGIDDGQVHRYKRWIKDAIKDRHLRRQVDVQMKAVKVIKAKAKRGQA